MLDNNLDNFISCLLVKMYGKLLILSVCYFNYDVAEKCSYAFLVAIHGNFIDLVSYLAVLLADASYCAVLCYG
jgi:hypothetical protein